MTNIESRIVRILSCLVLIVLGAGAAPPSVNRDLPFIEDDYPRGLAEARTRKLPLVVEVQTVVCAACRTMAATVLREPAITRQAPNFVWAKLEWGMLENSTFFDRFPVLATPTFLVIEPQTEKVLAKHVGLAEKAELAEMLDQSLKAFRHRKIEAAQAAQVRADGAYGTGQFAEAAKLYGELLKDAPRNWAGRSRAAELWLTALVSVPDYPECTRVARVELPRLPRDVAWVRSVGVAEYCVNKLADSAERAEVASQLDSLGRAALKVPVTPLARAALYANLLLTRAALKDEEGEKAVASAMFEYIDAARAKLGTAQERSALESFLLRPATTLGRIPQVLPYFEASQRELPDNPLAAGMLANAYAALNRFDDAFVMIDRAMSKSPAIVRINLISMKAGMFQRQGDSAAAGLAWDEAIHLAEGIPSSSSRAKIVTAIKAQREKAVAANAATRVAKP